jgi:predicted methyltransferase
MENPMKNLKLLYILPLVLFLATCDRASNVDLITPAVNHAERSDKDRERDASSKPAEILKLLDLRKGDHVADLFAGGGYYSELLGHVVGEKGEVIAHTVSAYKHFLGDAMEKRFENRMPQVRIYPSEPNDIELGTETLDAVLIVMSYHDLYFVNPEIDWLAVNGTVFLDKVYTALKPGGKLLIEDHAAKEGTGNADAQTLHRIEESFARSDIESHGFKLVQTSDVLRNPEDDHTKLVFDDSIRGKTDRFVLLFEKPSK